MKTLLSAGLIAALLTFPDLTKAQEHSDKTGHESVQRHNGKSVIESEENQSDNTVLSGTVEYDEKMVLDIHLDGDAAAQMPNLPREHTSRRVLYFNSDASLYENRPDVENLESIEEEGGHRMVVKIDQPDEKTYVDIVNKKIIDQREFMSRMFLIESPTETFAWKFTGNHRDILGYPCSEAIWTKDSVKTIAWFTSAIPVEAGPSRFSGLPGLILEIITNEGKRIISATSVKLEEVAGKIIKPTKGKKMTREQFNKMVEEKRKESGQEGGNHVVIKLRR